MSQSLTDLSIRGVNWSMLKEAGNMFLSLSIGVVLARILSPEDFGLLGMAVIFTGFIIQFSSVGIAPAIIQKRLLTDNHIRVSFTISVILGVFFTIALYFLSHPLSLFFKEPRVVPLIRTLSTIFVLHGLSVTSMGLLRRQLRFKSLFLIEIGSYIIAYLFFAIPMSLLGYGVWSLVTGILINTALSAGMLLSVSRHAMRPLLRKKEILELVEFGTGASINGILYMMSIQIDKLIVGRSLNSEILGLYGKAFQIISMIQTRFSFSPSSVLFPAYSKIQENEKRIEAAYLKAINVTAIIAFPVMLSVSVGAEYLVVGIYGEQWAGAVPTLRILCFAGMLKAVLHNAGAVVYATGNVYAEVWRQVINIVILFSGALVGIKYGLEGVAIAITVADLWLYVSMAYLVKKILRSNWMAFIKAQYPGLFFGFAVGMIDLLLFYLIEFHFAYMHALIKLCIFAFVSFLTFMACVIFMPISFKGEALGWIICRYSEYLPLAAKRWIKHFFHEPALAERS